MEMIELWDKTGVWPILPARADWRFAVCQSNLGDTLIVDARAKSGTLTSSLLLLLLLVVMMMHNYEVIVIVILLSLLLIALLSPRTSLFPFVCVCVCVCVCWFRFCFASL